MKKLILLMCMVVSYSYSQKDTYLSASFGADIRNAVVGSNPTNNNPALDYTVGFTAVAQNFEVNVGYENFKAIKFDRMSAGLGYHIQCGSIPKTDIKFTLIPSLKANMIGRTFTENYTYLGKPYSQEVHGSFFTGSADLAFNFDLTKNIAVQLVTDILPRPDIKYLYNDDKIIISNYFKIVYKFNNKKRDKSVTAYSIRMNRMNQRLNPVN